MKISASQLETSMMCGRKWWFQYKRKVPVYKKAYFGIGNVLHGCCERYLLGADDPFTDGWDLDPDTKKRLPPGDAGMVRLLVEMGIAAGHLERRPGGEVEQWFSIDFDGITLVGKKDHATKDRVEDHKTSKAVRYLKGKKALRENPQMLIYAYDLLCKARKRGEMPPRIITLAHNQFVTDKETPIVRRVEAETTPEEIELFWNTVIRPESKKIVEISTIEDPWTIPDPPKSACQAYGGCPFLSMCSGGEDILTYSARVANLINQPMASVSDFLKARTAGVPPASTTPAVNPPAPAATPPAEPAAKTSLVPPWAVINCGLCSASSTPGFKPGKGTPCRICISISKVSTDGFEWKIEPDGKATWWKKGEKVAETPAPATPVDKGTKIAYTSDALYAQLKAATTIEGVVELIKTAEGVFGAGTADLQTFASVADARIDAIEAPAPAIDEPAPAAEPTPVEPPKRPRGRPRKEGPVAEDAKIEVVHTQDRTGFILLIGASQMGPSLAGMEMQFAEQLLSAIPGYWQNDNVWERRQQLRKAFASDQKMAEGLNGRVIVQTVKDPDVDNLMSTLLACNPAWVVRGAM